MRRQKKSKINNVWKISIAVAAAAFVAIFVAVYFMFFASPVAQDSYYQLRSGRSVIQVATELKSANLIKSESLFKFMVRGFGGKIQAGGYDLPQGASVWRVARMVATGDIASTMITIPEGLTVRQIKDVLEINPYLAGEITSMPRDGELFPDTYRVAKGTNRMAVINLMKQKMTDIQRGWNASGKHAPYPLKDWNDVITLASIVQKETPRVSEMPTVASVYLNRLRKKMRLQADPTVVYAITDGYGDMQGRALLTGHLKTSSPYNTYTNYGLPPAPIANPGRDAISAVLNPADTTYLFFVADGSGGHNFARDYADHQKNHANWRNIKAARR